MWSRFDDGMSRPAESAAPPPPAAPQPAKALPVTPWHGQPEAVACDAAVRNLFNALPARLTLDGRVHSETCLAAIGAIAGFSAQCALFEHPQDGGNPVMRRHLRTATTRMGGEYLFGEPLNSMLVPASDAESNQRLWSLVVAGAINAGLWPSDLPDLREMFSHVATMLVSEAEGWPSVDRAHQPHMNGRETLQIVWPVAMDCFNGRAPNAPRSQAVATRHWPAITGHVAGALIQRTAAHVHPRTALILVIESAIYASKITSKASGAVAV
jgi:hypothetical protein